MLINKFLDPKNDFAFKRIFGVERNKDILIHFINDILGFSGEKAIQTVSFLKTSQDPEVAYKKQSILDVLCADELGRQYIIEMQVAKTPGFEKRAQYYAAKAYGNQLNQGEDYHNLKEIIFIAITNFIMFPDKPDYKSDHVILDKKHLTHDLKDFSFTFIELPKFNKTIDELSTIVEKWTYFFKHAEGTHEKELTRIAGADAVIERAYEELNRFSWSRQELFTYEQETKHELDNRLARELERTEAITAARDAGHAEGFAVGEAKGIEQGIQKGIEKSIEKGIQLEKEAIARNLLREGLKPSIIATLTGLSAEAVEKL